MSYEPDVYPMVDAPVQDDTIGKIIQTFACSNDLFIFGEVAIGISGLFIKKSGFPGPFWGTITLASGLASAYLKYIAKACTTTDGSA
jgi:hypothetical protein